MRFEEAGRAIVEQGKRPVQVVEAPYRDHITLIGCCCANGQALPPSFIYPVKTTTTLSAALENTLPGTSCFPNGTCHTMATYTPWHSFCAHVRVRCVQGSGWINGRVFGAWLQEVFIPQTRASLANPCVLVLDNHTSRLDVSAMQMAADAGVFCYLLLPNCTDFMQPLDVNVYGPLKELATVSVQIHTAKGNRVSRGDLLSLLASPIREAMSIANITLGWLRSGLYPVQQSVIASEKYGRMPVADEANVAAARGVASDLRRRTPMPPALRSALLFDPSLVPIFPDPTAAPAGEAVAEPPVAADGGDVPGGGRGHDGRRGRGRGRGGGRGRGRGRGGGAAAVRRDVNSEEGMEELRAHAAAMEEKKASRGRGRGTGRRGGRGRGAVAARSHEAAAPACARSAAVVPAAVAAAAAAAAMAGAGLRPPLPPAASTAAAAASHAVTRPGAPNSSAYVPPAPGAAAAAAAPDAPLTEAERREFAGIAEGAAWRLAPARLLRWQRARQEAIAEAAAVAARGATTPAAAAVRPRFPRTASAAAAAAQRMAAAAGDDDDAGDSDEPCTRGGRRRRRLPSSSDDDDEVSDPRPPIRKRGRS